MLGWQRGARGVRVLGVVGGEQLLQLVAFRPPRCGRGFVFLVLVRVLVVARSRLQGVLYYLAAVHAVQLVAALLEALVRPLHYPLSNRHAALLFRLLRLRGRGLAPARSLRSLGLPLALVRRGRREPRGGGSAFGLAAEVREVGSWGVL